MAFCFQDYDNDDNVDDKFDENLYYYDRQKYIDDMYRQGIPSDRLCFVDLHVLDDDDCYCCGYPDCPFCYS